MLTSLATPSPDHYDEMLDSGCVRVSHLRCKLWFMHAINLFSLFFFTNDCVLYLIRILTPSLKLIIQW